MADPPLFVLAGMGPGRQARTRRHGHVINFEGKGHSKMVWVKLAFAIIFLLDSVYYRHREMEKTIS